MEKIVNEICDMLAKKGLVFSKKPILIGGKAMEYYGLRKAGEDIDLVVSNEDYMKLESQYPNSRKDLYGDLGVILWPLEIWRSIALLDYDYFLQDAKEFKEIYVVPFERLLFMRVIAREVDKYNNDLDLMVEHIYSTKRNKKYLENANKHIPSYEKNNGVVLKGKYEDNQ